MLQELISNISQHGYLAIFLLIFLQEVGMPSPIPNELVLLFSGYLSFSGTLNLAYIILSVVAGDLLASATLFVLFYFFGKMIVTRKPKWIPISQEKLTRISSTINRSGQSGIFIGRLTPFIKGYVSVVSGLVRVSPRKYGTTLLLTSFIWSLAYVCCGYLLGPYWHKLTENNMAIEYLVLLIAAVVIVVLILLQVFKRLLSTTK